MDNQNPKRFKNLFSFFKNNDLSSRVNEHENNENTNESGLEIEDDQHERVEVQDELDIQYYDFTSLERDPGKRRPIGSYPLNKRGNIQRSYVVHGAYQPHLKNYPNNKCGAQGRRFCHKWFEEWHWLEYSIEHDKAYCFPCFLFDEFSSRHPSFTEDGFNGWKNVMSKQSEKVINTLSSQEVAKYRLRLIASIEAVRLLARQGCSFRGHDGSVDSLNGVDNAPGIVKYTSPKIQKQIANILGNKVRGVIRDEVGDSKFSILVDEALDVSNKEKMAIILRFVDREGLIRERFFKVISVGDTCCQTLKDEISKVLAQSDLQVENIRGQGYDGSNNMHGQFNGLQALFLRECPYTYYVHCFAHRLQLSLNAAAKGVHDVWQFFSTLTMIVNFVDSSAKRHSMLKKFREEEILDLVAAGTLEMDSGKNQACTLQKAGATRWGSHFRSISSLIKLFGATEATIDDLYINGVDKVQGEAKSIGKALKKFNFVFCLHMMNDIMRITDFFAIDFQMTELDSRFTESSLEILVLSASFDPRHSFRAFRREDVCKLALKYYPSEFSSHDRLALNLEFSTATTERAFSSMSIIKNKLKNKMNDDFLDDLMALYIERTYADNIANDDVIAEFELSGPRRKRL
ncbi:hypothetical protein RND81_12G018900 [Saponaria officinalis]|uniref:TTF-type domain-containing protein n=1 Tax=Saponaria officinalis TaxID=3572 RepID=A0AAW1H582_SAPOF